MSRFFNKIYICLAEPRKIGFFMPEKIWKSLIQLLLLAIIAISPVIVENAFKDRVSDSSKSYIEEVFVANRISNGLILKDGTLTGDEGLAFPVNEALIFINPNGEQLEKNEYEYLPVIELATDKVNVYYLDILLYSLSYETIGVMNLSFEKMCNVDYIEIEKFMMIINESFDEGRAYWATANSLLALFEIYLSIIVTALFLTLITSLVNKMVGFKFRFKGALDSQFIYLFFVLLANLFGILYIEYIGTILSIIYLIRALMSIVMIKVEKKGVE